MIRAVHRTEENDDGAPEAKELGTQVQDLLKRAAGADAYFEALNKARDKVATIRLTRKRYRHCCCTSVLGSIVVVHESEVGSVRLLPVCHG